MFDAGFAQGFPDSDRRDVVSSSLCVFPVLTTRDARTTLREFVISVELLFRRLLTRNHNS